MCGPPNMEVIEDVQVAVFSYQQVRDMITLKKGTLLSPVDIQYTSWGETVVTFESPSWEGTKELITHTHWGKTPLMENLKDVVR